MPTVPARSAPSARAARRDPDVLVIGGGVAGLFCAYHLRRDGHQVAVLESGQVGGPLSCSYGNTGFVGTQGSVPLAEPGVPAQGLRWLLNPQSPFYIRPRPDPELLRWLWLFRRACTEENARAGFRVLVDMKKRSLEILREVCASGALASMFTERGMVLAFRTEAGYAKGLGSVPRAVEHGIPLRAMDLAELREIEPDVDFDIHGALYNEEGACLRVPDFVVEFGRMLEGMGVDIHERTEVIDFDCAGHRIRRVSTTKGEFRPQEVVIAAGAWSAACARRLDIGLCLQPAKGYSVTVRAPGNGPQHPLLLSEGKVALLPMGDRLRIGGTLELSGLDARISRRRVEGILRTVEQYLPKMEATPTVEIWRGFRPCTPDGIPFTGRAGPYRNLSVSCGHGHVGMGLAPAGGKLIAQIVAGERPDMEPAPFRLGRFDRSLWRGGQARARGGRRAAAAERGGGR